MKNRVVKRLLAGVMCGVMTCSMISTACVQVRAEETEGTEETEEVKITAIAFDKTEVSMKTDETLQLTTIITPENATNQRLLYTSSNPLVVSVDTTGKVTARFEGTATITVIALDGSMKSASCKVTVTRAEENDTENNTEDSTENNTENNTEDSTENNTENNTEDSTENNTEDNTEDSTENNTENNTEDSTENNTENNTEDSTENNTENNTEENDDEELVEKDYTGLAYRNGVWKYYENGKWNRTKYGYVEFGESKFFIVFGKIATDMNGLVQDPVEIEDWYYLANGQVQTQYTGLAEYDGEWFYVEEGKLDTELSGYVSYDEGLFYVGAGRIMREVNGLAQDLETKDWYYLAEGQVQTQYTGLAEYDGAWFYVEKGVLDDQYTGYVKYDGVMFYVQNGKVKD